MLHWVRVEGGILNVMYPVEVSLEGQHRKQLQTHSFSLMSTWKHMMSPSWISLWVKVNFGFISSIIPGLISCARLSDKLVALVDTAYLIQLQGSAWWPPHALVDDTDKVADFATSKYINLADAIQCLLRGIKVFEEDHDGASHDLWFYRVGYYIQVQPKVVLLPDSHVVPNDLDG